MDCGLYSLLVHSALGLTWVCACKVRKWKAREEKGAEGGLKGAKLGQPAPLRVTLC